MSLKPPSSLINPSQPLTRIILARIHRFIQVDGVRTAEGCEGVTGAIIRA